MSKSTELTLPQRAAVALGSADHEAKLKELAAKHADIVEIKNPAGREQCHGAMMVLANARIAITKAGKEARDDATKFSKAVIEEEKRLIAIIEPEESRLRTMRDDWDAEREREKQAKAEAERQRIADLHYQIARIREWVTVATGRKPDEVAEIIQDVTNTPIDASFEEFQGQAQLAKDETLDKLREIHAAAVAREEEAARLKAEREELARLRAAEEERQRVAAAERAEEERKAREAYEAEQARLAEERAAQEAELRAQREAHERQLAAERAEADRIAREEEAKARAEREEADRVAREKWKAEQAELQAERERQAAEAQRLADERAEMERQQREAEEQRRRDEEAKRAAADAADAQIRAAACQMLDALRQWSYAEQTGDSEELANARKARDAAIDAATLVDAEFKETA
ncbi:hypothetical protein [Cupriavidus oxalaticus]|uniref:hypothetical protein n=1 Tax=Cupriavidus oxalaticus TaxID=96344 RepID=UPI00316FE87C